MTPEQFDPTSGEGGWNEWRYLVLHEIRRLTDNFEKVDGKLDTLLRTQDADRSTAETVAKGLAKELSDYKKETAAQFSSIGDVLHNKETGLVPRTTALEEDTLVASAVKKYRGWLVAGALAIVTSVVLPVLDVYLRLKGG